MRFFSFRFFLLLWLLAVSQISHAQNSNISGTINIYTPVTSILCNGVTVSSSSGFSAGDRVLLIQIKGATIDSTNTSSFGTILNYNNAGNYEFATVASVSGTTIYFVNEVLRTYTVSKKVQLVRVPQYVNATVTATLTAGAWNGSSGGVLVFEASGTVTMNANMNVNGLGFNFGAASVNYYSGCSSMNYYYTIASGMSGQKGEGITSLNNSLYGAGRGALANGGGGGNHVNSGGAGGGNYGAGGHGANQWDGCPILPIGGDGGKSLVYSNAQNKIFFGGGGGGGHQNNSAGTAGGKGGGIIIIRAASITGNSYSITANGNSAPIAGIDGSGGGGAAGTVLLDAATFTSLNVSANGGAGGNNNSTGSCHGPGGGGAGGIVWVSSSMTGITATFTGGASGILNNPGSPCYNSSYGALPGGVGSSLTGLVLQEGTVPFSLVTVSPDTTICSGNSITLTANGAVTYLWNPGAMTGSSVTVSPSSTTTYTVTGTGALCSDMATVQVVVMPVYTVNNPQTICNGDIYSVNGNNYSITGIYYDTMQTMNSCDSVVITQLLVNPTYSQNVSVSICTGDSYTFPDGTSSSFSVTQISDLTTVAGCDSIIITNLTVVPNLVQNVSASICQGSNYQLPGGQIVTAAGIYPDTLQNVQGCDSIIVTNLTVITNNSSNVSASICQGDNYQLPGGAMVSVAGVYNDTLQNSQGCDSIIVTNLTVITNNSSNVSASICQGDNYQLPGGAMVSIAGIYEDTLQNAQSCDSIIVTNLTVIPNSLQNISASICQGDNYQLPSGVTVSVAGIYQDTLQNSQSCDSVVTTTLSFYPPMIDSVNTIDESCFGYTDGEIEIFALGGTAPYLFQLTGVGNNSSGMFNNISPGNYVYSITDNYGCSVSGNCTINSANPILINVQPIDTTIYSYSSVNILSSCNYPNATFQWSPSDYLSCTDCANPVSSPEVNVTYTLTVSFSSNGNICTADTVVTIQIIPGIHIPNAFTPNGDNLNDYFQMIGENLQNISNFQIQIFNRWGQIIFESIDPDFKWDGTFLSLDVPIGAYVYQIKYHDNNNSRQELIKGNTTVIR